MNTSDILNRAADLIEERGWTQGNDGLAPAGPHCALGAIAAAFDCEDRYDYGGQLGLVFNPTAVTDSPAGLALCGYLGDDPGDVKAVWGWNDVTGRTATEVIAVLRAAAVIEAAKETADVPELSAR